MIKFIKLINGDDIVAKVEDHGDNYRVIWPVHIYVDRTEEGLRNRVEPYTPHVLGHTFNINKSRVMFMADPIPMLEEYYVKNNASMLPPTTDSVRAPGGEVVENES